MRIVQINGGAKGSTGKIMFGIAELARRQGHEVLCASPITTTNREAGPDCGYVRIGTFFSRRISVALARITGFNGCFAWFSTYRLLKRLDAFSPDVIHLHNLHDSYINLPMLFRYIKKHEIPVVWTLHDCWAFTGHCPHFTIAKCEKWKTGCGHCPQYRQYPASLFDNAGFMWRLKQKWFCGVENLTIVTPSKWLAGLAEQSFLCGYPIRVIHNGIDLQIFKPTPSDFRQRYGIPAEKKIVLGVSFAWSYQKGLDCFIALARRLGAEYRIVLVGTDAQIDKQLPENVISIHRTQDQKELAEIYTAADVFVNPTREEVLGLVNIEATACGTPVVVYDTGGAPECITKESGIVVHSAEEITEYVAQDKFRILKKDNCVQNANRFKETEKYQAYLRLFCACILRNEVVQVKC